MAAEQLSVVVDLVVLVSAVVPPSYAQEGETADGGGNTSSGKTIRACDSCLRLSAQDDRAKT